MKDRDFLLGVMSRLDRLGEDRQGELMRKLLAIAAATPADNETIPVSAPSSPSAVVFVRHARYIVIKQSEAREFLSDAERAILKLLSDTVARCRRMCGRIELECVVVESDWPEYEPTWKAIEARVTKERA